MKINLERDTCPQFYHFPIITSTIIFDDHSLIVRLECIDGNDIMDIILPKCIGELIPNALLVKIQIYDLIVCINKFELDISSIIMIANDS